MLFINVYLLIIKISSAYKLSKLFYFFFNLMCTQQIVKFILKKSLTPIFIPVTYVTLQSFHLPVYTHTSFFDLFLWAAINML